MRISLEIPGEMVELSMDVKIEFFCRAAAQHECRLVLLPVLYDKKKFDSMSISAVMD